MVWDLPAAKHDIINHHSKTTISKGSTLVRLLHRGMSALKHPSKPERKHHEPLRCVLNGYFVEINLWLQLEREHWAGSVKSRKGSVYVYEYSIYICKYILHIYHISKRGPMLASLCSALWSSSAYSTYCKFKVQVPDTSRGLTTDQCLRDAAPFLHRVAAVPCAAECIGVSRGIHRTKLLCPEGPTSNKASPLDVHLIGAKVRSLDGMFLWWSHQYPACSQTESIWPVLSVRCGWWYCMAETSSLTSRYIQTWLHARNRPFTLHRFTSPYW